MGKDEIIHSDCVKEEKMDLEEALKYQPLKAEENEPVKDTDKKKVENWGVCS